MVGAIAAGAGIVVCVGVSMKITSKPRTAYPAGWRRNLATWTVFSAILAEFTLAAIIGLEIT